jgi:hypothetical protein
LKHRLRNSTHETDIENWNTKSLNNALAPGFEYLGYAFEFTAVRDVQHYIWKVILPLLMIVIMSWAGFWIDPINANSQISVAVNIDAKADRLSLRRRRSGAAAALHDATRSLFSCQHPAGFPFLDRSFATKILDTTRKRNAPRKLIATVALSSLRSF